MDQFIPPIGTTGLYKLLTPFDTALTPDVPYSCIAIRKLTDIIAAGGNPLNTYYQSNSLATADYERDVAIGVSILSLQSSNGTVVYVPSSYVSGYPDIGGVPYSTLALAISLGPIPDSLDLSYLQDKIVSIVKETIGIDSEVHIVATSPPALLNYDDSKTIEAARLANISIVTTDYALYLQTLDQLTKARQQISLLENYIVSHPAPVVTP